MIKCIWIEIRPALSCCHFCVVLNENINFEVKIKVKKSNMYLDINGENFNVNFKDFTVEPLTMTAFKSANQCVSFRVQADCKYKLQSVSVPKLNPPVFSKEKASLLCQCHNPLTREVLFERILPLPSNDFSFSDLFCHLPSKVQPPNTSPRLSDCLYSDNQIVVNEGHMTGCRRKGKFLKCKRCLATVGVCDKNSIKFWTTSILLPFANPTLLDQFKKLIQKVVSDPLSMFPKILLECEETDTFLSIVVVDKNLVVSTCKENLLLKNSEVVKLKYRFHSSCDSHVSLLKEDPLHSVHHWLVPKDMLEYSTKYLISNSKTIPSIFSKVDDECMAYLNLCD